MHFSNGSESQTLRVLSKVKKQNQNKITPNDIETRKFYFQSSMTFTVSLLFKMYVRFSQTMFMVHGMVDQCQNNHNFRSTTSFFQ